MRHGWLVCVAILGWVNTAHGEETAGYPWRVSLVNQKTGASRALLTTRESAKVVGTGAWSCRVAVSAASTDLDPSTNEKLTKQSAMLSCTHGKARVDLPTTATSHVPALVTLVLSDADGSASVRLALESEE